MRGKKSENIQFKINIYTVLLSTKYELLSINYLLVYKIQYIEEKKTIQNRRTYKSVYIYINTEKLNAAKTKIKTTKINMKMQNTNKN